MAKVVSIIKPQWDVVYECYRNYTDHWGDRARKGQKFVVKSFEDDEEVVLAKASGRGVNIAVETSKFAAHFCPAATPEKKDATPQAAETPLSVEAHLVGGTWEDVKEHLDKIPKVVQELLKYVKPELFEAPEPKVFEFKEKDNTFGDFGGNTPFFVGKGLVNSKDKMKCLVVDRNWKAEMFEGPHGHQCLRFVKK